MSTCIAGGGSYNGVAHRRCRSSVPVRNSPPSTLSFPAKSLLRQRCVAASSELPAVRSPAADKRGTEKLDHWMRETVVEIVKSLRSSGEASASSSPLLVLVYGGDSAIRIRTERAEAEDWGRIKGKWTEEEPSPEGIMLVEELKDVANETDQEACGDVEGSLVNSNTKAWGVLLMGRGEEGGVASFLLKTTGGGGSHSNGRPDCCIHFSLVKVKSFRESTRSQLSNCWLVQRPSP